MKKFFNSILATVIAAAIVANVTLLFQFNARLAAIETYIKLSAGKTLANK